MRVAIKEFSGPLDLLLQLIRKEEMNIFDIDIHKITEQYLTFLKENSVPDLDSAGDFIRMAALLIYIKSKSLFPSENKENTEIDTEDSQEKLLQSLLKMQAVQSLCEKFNQQTLLNRDKWKSGSKDIYSLFSATEKKPYIKKQPLLNLMKAHQKVFQKKANFSPSIAPLENLMPLWLECLQSFKSKFTPGVSLKMNNLIKEQSDNKLFFTLMTFLALLELSRSGVISLDQKSNNFDIHISVKKQINDANFSFFKKEYLNSKTDIVNKELNNDL